MSLALFKAAEAGNVEAIEAQLAAGADIDWRHKDIGRTALIQAVIERHPEAVKTLLRHGASVNLPCSVVLHWAPLTWAAFDSDEVIARMLIAQGASLDLASADLKRTALMTAGQRGHVEMVRLLLEAGADPALLDHQGENARSLAKAKGQEAVVALLEEAGSGPPPPKPQVASLPWPVVEEGAERSTPESVVRAYALAMETWEAKGHARNLEAARDPAFWAEQKDIIVRCCTQKKRAFPFASYGSPSKHAASDKLVSVTQSSASRAEVIVLHFNGTGDWEHRFAVHRKGGEWRIDSLMSRMAGSERWERDIL